MSILSINLFVVAGVHDSYWTHACDVDQMNRILREKFVELYQTPILENVSTFLETELCIDMKLSHHRKNKNLFGAN